MKPPKVSETISDRELERIVEKGGAEAFHLPWVHYEDSPYAEYARKMKEQKENDIRD